MNTFLKVNFSLLKHNNVFLSNEFWPYQIGLGKEKEKSLPGYKRHLNHGMSKHQEVCFTPVTKVPKLIVVFFGPCWCNKKSRF